MNETALQPMDSAWLGSGFLTSLAHFTDRPALAVGEEKLSYGELADRAGAIAAEIEIGDQDTGLTAILASRSVAAYAGILGILFRGQGYVPLNPAFPAARLAGMLTRSESRTLIVDHEAEDKLAEILVGVPYNLVIIFADRSSTDGMEGQFPGHTLRPGLGATPLPSPTAVQPDDVAYLLFTSGSTGQPKGVMVSHANVEHFLAAVVERYSLTCEDRFSQMFDLVFDLSVFDLFAAWKVGGCLCCPSPGDVLIPSEFIRNSRVSVWFSVPSVAVLLGRLRQLEPGSFPDIRLSLFCGEALPMDAAAAWFEATSGARLENLYGPTEATLACTLYRWDADRSERECWNGLVPIGEPFPEMTAKVVDETLREVAPGDEGELMMSGPQIALGYWRDADKTAEVFVDDPETGAPSYRTGDLVRRPAKDHEPLVYLGRIDHQIKLHGHRVELGEIEAVLKEVSGASRAVAVGWPVTDSGIGGIAAFLEMSAFEETALLDRAAEVLPHYMIPKKVLSVPSFPLTSNGKVDRKALIEMLQG